VTVEGIILRLALDFQAYKLQAFPKFHLMILAIESRHIPRYTSSQDQRRTNQQRAKSHCRRSQEIPVHVCFLHKDVVGVSPRLAGCDSVRWCVAGALSTPIVLSKPHATHSRRHRFSLACPIIAL
jgi:hypothetical protein